MSSDYDFLEDNQAFEPPEPEFRLQQQSEKLVFSTRLFPSWLTAALAIFKRRYPDTPIDTSSKLIQLIVQDYIKQGYDLVGGSLPPTEKAIDLLINRGFVNPDSKSQFRRISKASQKATEYQISTLESGSLQERILYYRERDPEKAKELEEEFQRQVIEGINNPKQEEGKKSWKSSKNPEQEEIVDDNRSGLSSYKKTNQEQPSGSLTDEELQQKLKADKENNQSPDLSLLGKDSKNEKPETEKS